MKKLGIGASRSAFVVLVSLGGCSSSSPGGLHDTSAVDSFIQALAQAYCDWEFRCCKDPEIKTQEAGKFSTKDACLPYQKLAQANALYGDRLAVSDGRLRVDATHAAACLQQTETRACNPAPGTPPLPPNKATDCAHVFVGDTPVGGECIYANECVDGSHCVNTAAPVARGVCVPFQKVGEICNVSSDCDPLVDGIYCARQDFKCHVRGKVGEACAYTTDTGTPMFPMLLECDTSTGSIFCDPSAKVCANLPGDRQPCLSTPLPPGVGSRCNPDPTLKLVCDAGGTCRAPGQVGADCTTLPCAPDLYCARSGGTSTCAALPGLGAQCAGSSGRCAKPYFCNSGKTPAVCDQPAGLGQNCTLVPCDTGLFCDVTVTPRACKAQLPDGAACNGSNQCLSNICGGFPGTCTPRGVVVACTGR